jgi:hypothetical protein
MEVIFNINPISLEGLLLPLSTLDGRYNIYEKIFSNDLINQGEANEIRIYLDGR